MALDIHEQNFIKYTIRREVREALKDVYNTVNYNKACAAGALQQRKLVVPKPIDQDWVEE